MRADNIGPARVATAAVGCLGAYDLPDLDIDRTFTWTELPLDQPDALVRLTATLRTPATSDSRDIIYRFQFLDDQQTVLACPAQGLSFSDTIGHFVYPLRLAARPGAEPHTHRLYLQFKPPATATQMRMGVQLWRQAALSGYRAEACTIAIDEADLFPPANGNDVSELCLLELSLERQALEFAQTLLASDLRALPEGRFPFLEHAAATLTAKTGSAALAANLSQRLLRAGRSRAAVAAAGSSIHPQISREIGRIALHAATSEAAAPASPRGFGQPSRGLYLLHNCYPYHAGGYAARAQGVIAGMAASGVDLTPLARLGYPCDRGKTASAGDDHETHDGVTYHFLPAGAQVDQADGVGYVSEYADRIVAFASRHKPDFIQAASFYHNGFAGRIAADRLGVPLIYEMRGLEWFTRGSTDPAWFDSEQAKMMRDLEVRAALQADHVFAITQALAGWLVEQGVDESRISLLPNGCNPQEFSPLARSEPLADELGIEPDEFVLGYLGSIVFYEGIELAAEAVSRARRSGARIRLLIVGDGPHDARLKSHIRANDLGDACIMTGRVPHARVPEYYSLIDALALPRRDLPVCNYISPLKPFEALAMGKPLITSDVAAVKEIVDASGGGLTFPADDAKAFTDLLIAVSRDRDALAARGEAGRLWVEGSRSWAAIARNGLSALPR